MTLAVIYFNLDNQKRSVDVHNVMSIGSYKDGPEMENKGRKGNRAHKANDASS